MTEEKRAELLAALVKVEDLITRAAQALGQHPTHRELQEWFAKLVGQRGQLERVLSAAPKDGAA